MLYNANILQGTYPVMNNLAIFTAEVLQILLIWSLYVFPWCACAYISDSNIFKSEMAKSLGIYVKL